MMDHTMTKNPVSIPHFIWPADALRRAEKAAADSLGLTLFELMMRAGEAAFQRARADYPASKHWLILCGHGNNGGDGYVVARLAQADGIYRLSGRYFVSDDKAGGANQARSFDISVPLADDKPATIARAQSQAVGQLARQIAQLAGPGRSIRTSSAPVPDINDIFSQPLPPLEGS